MWINANHLKQMKTIIFLGLTLTATCLCAGQTWESVRLGEAPQVLEPEVDFLSDAPLIDGALDKGLDTLPIRLFSFAEKQKSDPLVTASYRLAYGMGFFYVYVEAKADRLIFRDRAYQNGDGFVLALAKPRPNNQPTDEFYVLACSAVNRPALEWTRRIFWYFNVDKIFIPTSEETKLEFREGEGKISFELLLPWSDVRPYHPLVSEGIGFNLAFTKAVEPNGSERLIVVDDEIGAEYSKRKYATLRFQKPLVKGKTQTFVAFLDGHLTEGDSLRGIAVTVSDKTNTETLTIRVEGGEGRTAAGDQFEYPCATGVTTKEFAIGMGRLLEGGYMVRWSGRKPESRGTSGLSIIPKFLPDELNKRLEKSKNNISTGTYSTAQFLVQELNAKLTALKPYETCFSERLTVAGFMRMLNSAEQGVDPFDGRTGFIRKAYRSKVDSTLQPYVVYVPGGFDKKKTYPLLVFLHGSASNETNIVGFQSLIPGGFFALGPFGRGPSNAFARDHAQEDIAEAITAVQEAYPIDASRILLTGFSMGGYGVYRTFYETPAKYRAVAVFSGAPNMGRNYASNANPPDFTEERNLQSFRNIPIFIYHGEKDRNVPIEATRDLVGKLEKVGAQVKLWIEPDRGHERPSREGTDQFLKWVGQVLKEK